MLIVAGTARFDPAHASLLSERFDAARTVTLQEEGCLHYEYYLSRSEPGVIFIFEKWESDEALAKHMQSAHNTALAPVFAQIGMTESDVHLYPDVVETPIG